jgi:hypothetical protein
MLTVVYNIEEKLKVMDPVYGFQRNPFRFVFVSFRNKI